MKELHCATAYEWIVTDLDEGLEPEKAAYLGSPPPDAAQAADV